MKCFIGVWLALLTPAAICEQMKTVTGIATYRERIALPAGAVFETVLSDVSPADAAADVIGRTRLENAGNPPFPFSISYDPARIAESRSYAVRATVTVGGRLMFTTYQSYPVLTKGHGSDVPMIIMRRIGAADREVPDALGALPASFGGDLPCADCPAIRYVLNLFPDKTYFLRTIYVGRGDAKPIYDIGRWSLSGDGSTLRLSGGKNSIEGFAVKAGGVLRKLDTQGHEIASKLNYDLRRSSSFQDLEPRLAMRGMFRYMADAAIFAECQTGQRWPVAMEEGYKELEAAYVKTRRATEELLVSVEARVTMKPTPDGGRLGPALVVERYLGIWPGETCDAPFVTAPLQGMYWKLTRLGDFAGLTASRNDLLFHRDE